MFRRPNLLEMTMPKIKRVAIYLRVSTDGQTVENQRRELEAAAERHGWHVAGTFTDQGISGSKGREQRPGLDRMLKGIARRSLTLSQHGRSIASADRLSIS